MCLWNLCLSVTFCCDQFWIIFSHHTFFQNVSPQAPFGQSEHILQIFYSELNEDCEKICFFFILSPKGGVLGVQIGFTPIILSQFFSEAFYWPPRTKSKILRCTYFQKLYKVSIHIYHFGFQMTLGLGRAK